MNEALLQTVAEDGLPLAWIDMVGLGLVALFLVLGLVRGLWWQIIRLLGVAAAVGLSVRTLQRRLAAASQSHSALVAEVRFAQACVRLRTSSVPPQPPAGR